MTLTSRYWQMVTLTSAGQRKIKAMPSAKRWCQTYLEKALKGTSDSNDAGDRASSHLLVNDHLGDDRVSNDRTVQTYLWQRWQARDESAPLALLCLRCWLSHQIVATCSQLASQFGRHYGFVTDDLLPLVLDDDGRLSLVYQPLSVKILERYDPSQAALSTWTSRMTKAHPEINRFCLDRGLYRISDWALLNDTSVGRLSRALPGLSPAALKQKVALLTAYHQVYRRDRIIQRQQSGRASRCLEPTDAQLLEIRPNSPPALVLQQLCELAEQLREHRIAMRRGMPITQSLDATIDNQPYLQPASASQTEGEAESKTVQDEFVQRYRSHFLESLDEAITAVAKSYASGYEKRQRSKGRLFLSALNLFHCEGLSMGVIAQKIGLSSQVQVTRLLKLKRFRTEVCAHWFNRLKQQIKAEALQFIAPERLSTITEQLETILSEETSSVMTEAAAEAQISKNRAIKSTFARQLCARLPTIFSTIEASP
ncbi:hypothetical protein S7335_2593 [Synechococcus sp. PCC 7335]|uniref:hypothetical protein n=1 Tax=Synechococcus sp. (strain ATCC 29403 / PCC 7335) TaxID=91464 RepID=UPI00017EE0A1|nr:hypothetical protein [Synechococcus sp. PCC 7335]EDX84894.1 hypothetical protein S7335_2593 [Synechococcus sp. PCC 7335]